VEAAQWAYEKKRGSKATCNAEDSPYKDSGLTYNMIEPLLRELKETGKISDDRDHHKQILTNMERCRLAEWILQCADGQDPKDRLKVSAKAKEILRARHTSNKKKKYGAGSVKLNKEEVNALESGKQSLSAAFFQHFYPWCRAHNIAISEGVDRAQDEKRSVKHTEAVVRRHFFGEFGLEAELVDAGLMDAEAKAIKDPRRLLNSDETPQPIDMPQKGSRKKVAKRQGKPARKAGGCNKESLSVNMAWDLSGHLYGAQLVLKRKELSDDMAVKAPCGARAFDDVTDLAHRQSRYCLLSRTADGMQTQQSFIEYLEHLDQQITARSEAEVAAGGEPIERPVVLCLDNHASRYSEEVLIAASGQSSRLGIRLFTEEAGTSGFLQSLDQYNSKFHRHYNKGRDAWKEAYEARHKKPCSSFGLIECLKVLAGDAELGLPGMWFSWADPFDIVTAWRKVGIAGNVLAPELIDRSEFIDQPPAAPTPPAAPAVAAEGGATEAGATEGWATPRVNRKRAADLVKTPEGMVSGSLESERAKVSRLLAYAQGLEAEQDAPFDPAAAGLLVPTAVTRPERQQPAGGRKRLSDLHGSVTMRNVGGEAQKRRLEAEEAAAAVAERKRQREAKKAADEREVAERNAAFARCEGGCMCGVVPCPWAKWKRCMVCGPKLGLCKARACVAARKPLLLGYNPNAEAQSGAEVAQ
jgi:hypothetical protein